MLTQEDKQYITEMFEQQTKQFNERFDELAAQNTREHDAVKGRLDDHEGRMVVLEQKAGVK